MRVQVTRLEDLRNDPFPRYRVKDLQAILKGLGLSFSIYTIRDYETWKCTNYKCGRRHNSDGVCLSCGSKLRKPLIDSPRTSNSGRGPGHRRYTSKEIKDVVKLFSQRT